MVAFCSVAGSLPSFARSAWCGTNVSQSVHETCTTRKCADSRVSQRVVIRCGRRGGGANKRRGDGRRPNRVAELIRREMSGIIDDAYSRAFFNQDGASSVFVSVVDVKCSDDLRNAKVSVSVLGTDTQRKDALLWLKSARKDLRFAMAQRVHLKYIPELMFTESEMSQALKTVTILDRLAREREEKKKGVAQPVTDGEWVAAGTSALTNAQELELNASSNDGLILDDLDMEGVFDVDIDDDDDANIVHIGEEDLEALDDEDLKRTLFNTLEDENFARR